MSQQATVESTESEVDERERLQSVGTSEQRVDALGKVTGDTDYTADIPFDDLAHAKLVRSAVPHGRVDSIDAEAALSVPGVIDVVLPEDIPGEPTIGNIIFDQPLLSGEKVRYLGDPVAIVVAEDEATALQAVGSVDVEYDELPHALTAEAALADDAAQIHDSGNLMDEFSVDRGAVDAAFRDADVVVSDTYESAMIDHLPLEPESSVARRSYDDTVEVWTSTQDVHRDRRSVARVLGLKESDVSVTQPAVGGGFGSKIEPHQPCYAAVASWITDRPVRVKYKRDEDFEGTAKRNTMHFEYRLAADADGTFRAFDIDLTVDGGAYASFTVPVAVRSIVHSTGPYNVPAVDVDGRAVYTNKPWSGAMRSFDMFQTTFAIESIIDQLAAETDVDPVEIRRLNAFDGSRPMTTTGQTIDAVGLPETIDAVAAFLDDLAVGQPDDPSKHRGVGVACMWYGCGKTGHHHPSSAFCEIHPDGTATVQCGAAEIGQGSQTALTQIAAETLGIPSSDVNFVSDTSTTPDGGVTSASRQTYVSGNAVRLAADDALETVLTGAADLLSERLDTDVPIADLHASGGDVTHVPTGETVSFAAATDHCAHTGRLMTGASAFTPLFEFDLETFEGEPYPTYSFATHGVVVEVDSELGEVTVEHAVASHDVGQAVNPALVEGQIEGGAVMGMGHTILEEVSVGDRGEIRNGSLLDYYIPTIHHAPDIETHIVESAPEDDGPYGAKGVGESALIPIGAAIANAVADATGARVTTLPLKPDHVLAAMPDELSYL